MASGDWDLALAGVLVIVLGVIVIVIPELWSPVGIFAIGVGTRALAVLATRILRGRRD